MPRYAFVEFGAPSEAVAAVKALHRTPLDKKHTLLVNKLTDIERYGREGRVEEEYKEPHIEPFQEKEHLRSWLSDPRDQIAMYRDKKVGVFWHEKEDAPEPVVDREHWTELFVEWSPLGTFLMSVHDQGVQLWGGKSWSRQKRFAHPGVKLVNFSPNEKYLVTWSPAPLQVDESRPIPNLSMDEDGKNYIIWDIATAKPIRSFVTIDLPPSTDENGQPVKKKLQWPTFKWSADDKYVARMTQGQSIAIYELPRMNMLDKASIKIEGVMDFEWAPATPQREGIKTYEQLLCYWTPELGSAPAKVGLMSIPSKEIVRTRNLFNVADAKLHWQSDAAYVCVKVDIQKTKSRKSMTTNLEIFRIKEKGVPVEVIDSVKETVINFAWEPKGNRFCLITTGELPTGPSAPKTAVAFFAPEKTKGNTVGNFKHVRTLDKKNSNGIYWSPKGRFVVVATLGSQASFDLDFWDLDFEGVPDETTKDLQANLQLMASGEHYGITSVEWDPSGRYVATVSSAFMHPVSYPNYPYTLEEPQLFSNRITKRWKTATRFGISRARSCARSKSSVSSSSCGGPARRPCCRRRNRRRSARTCASTARSSRSRTSRRRTRLIAPWSRSAAASSRNGSHGASASSSSSRRTRSRFWAATTAPSIPRTARSSRRSSRRLSKRARRSCRRRVGLAGMRDDVVVIARIC